MTFLGKACDINDTYQERTKTQERACLQGKNFIIHKIYKQQK